MRRWVKPSLRRVSMLDALRADSMRAVKGAVAPVVTKHSLEWGVHFQVSAMVPGERFQWCEAKFKSECNILCPEYPGTNSTCVSFVAAMVRCEMQGGGRGDADSHWSTNRSQARLWTSRKVDLSIEQANHTHQWRPYHGGCCCNRDNAPREYDVELHPSTRRARCPLHPTASPKNLSRTAPTRLYRPRHQLSSSKLSPTRPKTTRRRT